jgi:tetratricopeptide (TPR) repeat protein
LSVRAALTDENSSLLDHVTRTAHDMRRLFPQENIPDPEPFTVILDSICTALASTKSKIRDSAQLVDTIIRLIYTSWRIEFDPDREDIGSLLPHTVILNKKGSCLGVSLLFLLIAEKLGYPLFGVLLPGHFFVRYDDGVSYRNIEPNRKGYRYPLAYYRMRYSVRENSWYTLKNLSRHETVSVLFFNAGNCCMRAGNSIAARDYFKSSVAGLDGFAEAWGNLAIIYAARNQADSARAAFETARRFRPGLEGLAQNFGAFELSQGRYEPALNAYRHGLHYFPDDPELLYGMAFSFYALAQRDSAVYCLTKRGNPLDTSSREYKLLRLLSGS